MFSGIDDVSQNPYEPLTKRVVERNLIYVKTQLYIALITTIRKKGWSQAQAAIEFNVSQPRISNLFNQQLDKFSIDKLLDMLVRCGYSLDTGQHETKDGMPTTIFIQPAKP